jgi:hypothetical protein
MAVSKASPLEVFGSTAKAPCFCAICQCSPSHPVTMMMGNEKFIAAKRRCIYRPFHPGHLNV